METSLNFHVTQMLKTQRKISYCVFWPNVYFNTGPRVWWKQNHSYVFLYIFITFRTTTINCSQLSDGNWTVLFEWIWFTNRHDKMIRHKLPSRMTSLTSLAAVASKITGVHSPRTARNCVSENSKNCFANTQAESHVRITRNPTFQETTTVDFKIRIQTKYTKCKVLSFYKINIVRYMRPNIMNIV